MGNVQQGAGGASETSGRDDSLGQLQGAGQADQGVPEQEEVEGQTARQVDELPTRDQVKDLLKRWLAKAKTKAHEVKQVCARTLQFCNQCNLLQHVAS